MIDFELLYDKHIDDMFAFGSRLTGDRELIKDCIHDVFVKLYTKRHELDRVVNIDSYLYVALRNRINDEFRRNTKIGDVEISDNNMRRVAEHERKVREERLRKENMTNRIDEVIDRLSPRQRELIHLYYVEHMKYSDICRVMGINYQSVRNLMHRSITRIRTMIAETPNNY